MDAKTEIFFQVVTFNEQMVGYLLFDEMNIFNIHLTHEYDNGCLKMIMSPVFGIFAACRNC